jgi:hypothetical protein
MSRVPQDVIEGKKNSLKRAESQRDFVLKILREAGASGISKLDFLHGSGLCRGRLITQISARIAELESGGYRFDHRHVPNSDFVTFALLSEPNHQNNQQKSACEQQTEPGQMALGLAPTSASAASSFLAFECGLKTAESR